MSVKNIRQKVNDEVYVNLIKTDKFKTVLISVYIIRPLTKDEVTKNALIPLVLKRGSKKYDSSLKIQKRLEELYGANLSINVDKKGEKHLIRFTIEFPSSLYVKEENLNNDVFNLLMGIISNPYLEGNGFCKKYVEGEKENLKKRIIGRINDKKSYAIDRCIEEMCKGEKFSIYKYGYVDDLEEIDEISLYNHYNDIIKNSPIEISVVGDIDLDKTKDMIGNIFKFHRGDIVNLSREEILKEVSSKNMVNEEMDVNQGKLTLGLRTNLPYEDELYEALILGNNILGGGANSKLFKTVREKESLAYYIYSKSYKFKSLMLIASGIEFENYNKALEIIKKEIEEMKTGNFSDNDMEASKVSVITSIRSMIDSNYSLSEFYLSQSLTNDERNIEQLIEKIRSVKKDEIVKSFKKISLDTIYFLRNKEQ